ncbi:hypothetical protein VPH35_028891 [Triticum aestivum]
MHEEDQGGGSNPGRYVACKYLRGSAPPTACSPPTSRHRNPHRYAVVHLAFGANKSLPVDERAQAAETMAMEAWWLVEDPVYVCDGIISQLQEEIQPTQCKLTMTRAQLAIVPVHGAQLQDSTAALPPPQPQRDDGHRVPVPHMQGQGHGKVVLLLDPDNGHRVTIAQMQGQGEAVSLLNRPGRQPPRPRRAEAEAGRGGGIT